MYGLGQSGFFNRPGTPPTTVVTPDR
jgi:hypothetical protein